MLAQSNHYDVLIVGAGMSGLAAGIRLAYFDKRVCILEKHYAYGGLNSYYKLDGREYDVGLHAVTNYVPPGVRSAPLPKLLRQLRLKREDFDLHPQRYSEIRFPQRRLRFTNDVGVFVSEVSREYPEDERNFRRLLDDMNAYDDVSLEVPYRSARKVLGEYLHDPSLIEMLLCPIMYYGSAQERDMDFTQFVTMFKSLFCQGFARPPGGVRTIIKTLVRKFRSVGGRLRMNNEVCTIDSRGEQVTGVTLTSGEKLTAPLVFSTAGYPETMRLCGDKKSIDSESVGQISFVETIAVLDQPPANLGHETTIVFFNDDDSFHYAVPEALVDLRSGVVCCPTNYQGHDHFKEGLFRVTWLANPKRWMSLGEEDYRSAKRSCLDSFHALGERFIKDFRSRIVVTDMFTPRTIEHFTGRINGAVYGSPVKRRDGRTEYRNLYICGTDQGFLGIIGAMLSGVTIANLYGLDYG